MLKNTPLHDLHKAAGARMVDFGGWDMPVNYGSQIDEHHAVRNDAGMFDVSHMTVVDMEGPWVQEFLRHLLANDVAKLKEPGKALYSCMLNNQAGIIDDLIVYFMRDGWFRMVVNAATHDKDLAWINQQAQPYGITLTERNVGMIAVQGPNAREKAASVLPASLRAPAPDRWRRPRRGSAHRPTPRPASRRWGRAGATAWRPAGALRAAWTLRAPRRRASTRRGVVASRRNGPAR